MNTTTSAPQAHSAANTEQIDTLIAHAKACGKYPPAVESLWRYIGEKDILAIERLIGDTSANPAFAVDVCRAADRAIDRLLYPILSSLINARATIAAFGEAALDKDTSNKLQWPILDGCVGHCHSQRRRSGQCHHSTLWRGGNRRSTGAARCLRRCRCIHVANHQPCRRQTDQPAQTQQADCKDIGVAQ
jgi:hypothetical protein